MISSQAAAKALLAGLNKKKKAKKGKKANGEKEETAGAKTETPCAI